MSPSFPPLLAFSSLIKFVHFHSPSHHHPLCQPSQVYFEILDPLLHSDHRLLSRMLKGFHLNFLYLKDHFNGYASYQAHLLQVASQYLKHTLSTAPQCNAVLRLLDQPRC
jgi:hypothetical protein